MYFYRIEVYHSFTEPTYMIMSHKYYFDNHQLNIIVQEAFDECIEKYCDKPLLEKGEEACRMEVETIFEEYLPLQLKNHGFKIIKINETCSIMGGTLFCDNGVNNPVLMDRYKNEVLPPCKKCMRGTHIGETYIGYEGKCIVHNTRKNPLRCHIKPFDENEEENTKDDFNISVLKQYFINSCRSVEESIIADAALENILNDNDFKNVYTNWGVKADGIHEGDIICSFYLDNDNKRCKKLLEKYGFILEDTDDDFWITGVKE